MSFNVSSSEIAASAAFVNVMDDYDFEMLRGPVINSISCKCLHPLCDMHHFTNFECTRMDRDLAFKSYFPDLFLNNVPKEYSIEHIHSIFSQYGGEGVLHQIIIVPEEDSNIVVVKFNEWNISNETYERTRCMRWNFYKNTGTGTPGKIIDIHYADVHPFDEFIWKTVPRFGVEYNYSLIAHDCFLSDPRGIYLYEYLNREPYVRVFTDDAICLADDSDLEDYYQDDFLKYVDSERKRHEEYLLDSDNEVTNPDVDSTMEEIIFRQQLEDDAEYDELYRDCELEDGEIDESEESDEVSNIDSVEEELLDLSEDDEDDQDDCINTSYGCESDAIMYYEDGLAEVENQEEIDDYDDENQIYEYCEIGGVMHRRLREENEDPDELHRRISSAKNIEDRAIAFWG